MAEVNKTLPTAEEITSSQITEVSKTPPNAGNITRGHMTEASKTPPTAGKITSSPMTEASKTPPIDGDIAKSVNVKLSLETAGEEGVSYEMYHNLYSWLTNAIQQERNHWKKQFHSTLQELNRQHKDQLAIQSSLQKLVDKFDLQGINDLEQPWSSKAKNVEIIDTDPAYEKPVSTQDMFRKLEDRIDRILNVVPAKDKSPGNNSKDKLVSNATVNIKEPVCKQKNSSDFHSTKVKFQESHTYDTNKSNAHGNQGTNNEEKQNQSISSHSKFNDTQSAKQSITASRKIPATNSLNINKHSRNETVGKRGLQDPKQDLPEHDQGKYEVESVEADSWHDKTNNASSEKNNVYKIQDQIKNTETQDNEIIAQSQGTQTVLASTQVKEQEHWNDQEGSEWNGDTSTDQTYTCSPTCSTSTVNSQRTKVAMTNCQDLTDMPQGQPTQQNLHRYLKKGGNNKPIESFTVKKFVSLAKEEKQKYERAIQNQKKEIKYLKSDLEEALGQIDKLQKVIQRLYLLNKHLKDTPKSTEEVSDTIEKPRNFHTESPQRKTNLVSSSLPSLKSLPVFQSMPNSEIALWKVRTKHKNMPNRKSDVAHCLRCQKIFKPSENSSISCRFHRNGQESSEKYDGHGRLVRVIYKWACCQRNIDAPGCTHSQHI